MPTTTVANAASTAAGGTTSSPAKGILQTQAPPTPTNGTTQPRPVPQQTISPATAGTSATTSGAGGILGGAPTGTTPPAAPSPAAVPNFGAVPGYTAPQVDPSKTPMADTTASTASPWTVTNDQLVQANLAKILGSNSPLMGQASLQADQAMASRGILNSSMTAGAEEQSMINSALPIAQADAQTQAAAAAQTAQETTQANLATAAQKNAAAQQQAGAEQQTLLANQQAIATAGQFNSQAAITAQQTVFGAAFQANTQVVDATSKAQLQSLANQSAQAVATISGTFSSKMQSTQSYISAYTSLQNSIADVLKNTTDAAAAQNQIGTLIASFQAAIQPISNVMNLDLASNFSAVPGAPGPVPGSSNQTGTAPSAAAPAPAAAPAGNPILSSKNPGPPGG